MTLHLDIPDDGDAERLLRELLGANPDRAVLEALAIECYRSGKCGIAQVRRLLGFADRWETERWLGSRGVYLNYTMEDLEADRATIERLFGKSA